MHETWCDWRGAGEARQVVVVQPSSQCGLFVGGMAAVLRMSWDYINTRFLLHLYFLY